jgi:hypothetical protein
MRINHEVQATGRTLRIGDSILLLNILCIIIIRADTHNNTSPIFTIN